MRWKFGVAIVVMCIFCVNMSFADVGEKADADTMMKFINDLQKQIGGLEKEVKGLRGLEGEVKTLRTQVKEKNSVQNNLENKIISLENEMKGFKGSPKVLVPSVSSIEVPSWIKGTHFGGDLRVRFQSDFSNKALDRHRGRFRLRYGISKQVNDELFAKFRLATGPTADRVNYQETMGSADAGFDKINVWIDQAYLKYTPSWLDNFTVLAGKFPQNWKDKGLLVHGERCGFDGLGESYKYKINDSLDVDVNLAQLIVSEGAAADSDSELYVFDAGIKGKCNADYSPITRWGLRGTAYLFSGYSEVETGAAPAILGGTNTTPTMGNPRVLVGTADLGFDVNNIPIDLFVQGAINTNDHEEGNAVRDQNKYYAFGVYLNKLKKPGDMALEYKFAYLERNAMPSQMVEFELNPGNHIHYVTLWYRLFPSTDVYLELFAPRSIESDRDTHVIKGKLKVITRF